MTEQEEHLKLLRVLLGTKGGEQSLGATWYGKVILIDAERCLKSSQPLLQYLLIAYHEWCHVTNPELGEEEVERLSIQDLREMLDRVVPPTKERSKK